MKKLAIFGAIALAACSGADEAATDEAATGEAATEEVAVEEAGSTAADGGPSVGTYQVTKADGTMITYTANEDGTYVVTSADGEQIEAGTWRQDGPNRWCDTAEGEEEECFTETMVDGVYTSTSESDPTETSTIVRVS